MTLYLAAEFGPVRSGISFDADLIIVITQGKKFVQGQLKLTE